MHGEIGEEDDLTKIFALKNSPDFRKASWFLSLLKQNNSYQWTKFIDQAMKIYLNYELSYDLNNDGLVNEHDITLLISIIFEQSDDQFLGDLNLDSKIDIIDLLYLSDHFYD